MTQLESYWRRVSPFATTALTAAALLLLVRPARAQTGTVEGRISAATTGSPVIGAQVSVSGTNLGTRTGDDGRFILLNLPAGTHQLRITAIGYKAALLRVTVEPGATVTADAELTPSVLQLDEIVVTGTPGQARLRELGNTIESIDLSAEVKDPPASMDQLLQARATGMTVMQGTGSAGAGAQIRLRGAVSVSQSNQPIIYVDGIRVRSEGYARNAPAPGADFTGRSSNIQMSPLNDLNPADIERIEIIKGSAASTLYGTEAAAGVIQIFTRKGSRGAPRWNVQMDQGFARLPPFGTDWNPYLNFKPGDSVVLGPDNQLRTAVPAQSAGYCPELIAGWREEFRRTGTFPTPKPCDWLRQGHRQKLVGSVTGGFDAFRYFVSGSWEDYDGVLPQDNERRVVTRGNFSFDVSDDLRLDWNTAYSNYNVRNTPTGNNAQGLTLNVYRAERNYRSSSNPVVLDSLLNQSITTEVDRLITGGSVYYTPLPQFSNRFTVGLDLANQENRNLRPFGFVAQPLGVLFDEQNKYMTLTADYVGNLDFRIAGDLASTFSFGGQSITRERISTFAFGRDFPGPGNPTVSNGATFLAREQRIRDVTAGVFFQNVFKLRDRYFLTLGARFDGNSAFGQDFGIQGYPKASVSYVVSEEPWWPSAWGEVKLRAALGWAGRAPGAFDAVKTWNPAVSGGQSAFLPGNVGNPKLGPERTREIEVGFDGAFLNNRVSAEFTWYQQQTTDALFSVRQIPSVGFPASQLANVGTMRNSGIEAAINGTLFERQNWGLELGMTFYTNHSLVLDLGGAPPFAAGFGWMEEGFPIMAAKGVRIRNPDAIAAPDTACAGSCASDGQYIFGPQQPTFVWGTTATLRLPKGVTLSARGEYQGGAWIYDAAAANALQRSVRWPTCRRAHLILEGGGTQDQLTARERLECIPAQLNDDVLWFPQDFFKLRDVTLTVPVGAFVSQARGATLSLTAQNWVRWINSDLRMFDPEMTDRDSLDDQNRQISEHIPPAAVFTASLRVTF
ncbi:MAG TPA: TonB-dependent receptor [Gemmatimonadales bacterium]|nr:TonB-dependent receptor [Gemmatimonadales bacterium]